MYLMVSIFQGSHKMLLVGFLPTHVSSFMSPKGALVLLNPLPGFETMHAIGIKYRILNLQADSAHVDSLCCAPPERI